MRGWRRKKERKKKMGIKENREDKVGWMGGGLNKKMSLGKQNYKSVLYI